MAKLKNKQSLNVVFFVVLIFIFSIILKFTFASVKKEEKSDPYSEFKKIDPYNRYAEILKNYYPMDIILYGDYINIRDTVNYRHISKLTKDNLESNATYKTLIIHDLLGELNLADEEWELVRFYVQEKKYDFIYFGRYYHKINEISHIGGFSRDSMKVDDIYCYLFSDTSFTTTEYINWSNLDDQAKGREHEDFSFSIIEAIARTIRQKNDPRYAGFEKMSQGLWLYNKNSDLVVKNDTN